MFTWISFTGIDGKIYHIWYTSYPINKPILATIYLIIFVSVWVKYQDKLSTQILLWNLFTKIEWEGLSPSIYEFS